MISIRITLLTALLGATFTVGCATKWPLDTGEVTAAVASYQAEQEGPVH